MDREIKSTPASTLLFGSATGLALFLGECGVGALHGGQFTPFFYLAGLPVYALFGCFLGAITLTLGELADRLSGPLPLLVSKPGCSECVTSAMAILIQGTIVVNELILSGSPFSSSLSISIDLVWIILVTALFQVVLFLGTRSPSSFTKFAYLCGLALASYSLSSLYLVIDRPISPAFGLAAAQTIAGVLLVAVSLITPLLICRLVSSRRPTARILSGSAPAASVVALAAAINVLSSANSEVAFEQRFSPHLPHPDKPNIVLIVVDTLRADHLSSYGYNRNTSPKLDAFGRDSVIFKNCISPANWTPPGHASIFTGRYPISHGTHKVWSELNPERPNCFPLDTAESTIAEILGDHGYQTAAIVANYGFVSQALGLDQGFQFWFDTPPTRLKPLMLSLAMKFELLTPCRFLADPVPYRRASDVTDLAIKWTQEFGDRPFFLFVNLMDPHSPYSPPNPWGDSFPNPISKCALDSYHSPLRRGLVEFSDPQWSQIISQYDGEVAYVDSELGKFFEVLKQSHLYTNSTIIVTSDHGEFLGENGLLDHQIGLYQPVIHVPLIYKPAQGTVTPKGLDRVVQTVDILPTVLDSLSIEIPSNIQGSSLINYEPHPIIAQHYADLHISKWFSGRFNVQQTALIQGPKKLILSQTGQTELLDFFADPKEVRDLSTREKTTHDQMAEVLKHWLTMVDIRERSSNETPSLDDETIRRLRSLGYVD